MLADLDRLHKKFVARAILETSFQFPLYKGHRDRAFQHLGIVAGLLGRPATSFLSLQNRRNLDTIGSAVYKTRLPPSRFESDETVSSDICG